MSAKAGKPSAAAPPSTATIQNARQLVLYMLMALGTCTIVTAILLVVHTMDAKSDGGLVWISRQQAAGGAAKGGKGGATGEPAKPITKDLDPDYVEPAAKQAAILLKKCPAGCEARGNCNAEEGRCECPFGYIGATCEKPLFPACKMRANATEMHCGDRMPRSCECLRQCRAFFCPNKGRCETPRDPWFVRCFERAKPANSSAPLVITSDIPEEWEEKKGLVRWYRGIRADLQRETLTRAQATYVSARGRGADA